MVKAADLGRYFRVPMDQRGLNYDQYYDQGEEKVSKNLDYTSHNTDQLDVEGMVGLLRKLTFVKAMERGEQFEPEES